MPLLTKGVPVTIEGVDYAWDRPTVSGLVAAGKKFVVRYGGPGSDGKQIWADELRQLLAAGIAVVANAEGTANGFRGRTAGIAWAKDAEAHFRGLGMPGDRPIYFSADWDVQAGEMDEVDAALRGAAEVVGAARVGLYGGYNVIRHAQAAGTARWFWQTYAWSGGRWASGAHLQQYRNGVSLAGGTVDLNRAMVADFGQWGQGIKIEGVAQMFCISGDRGQNVKYLQYRLHNLGFSVGTVDGIYGGMTATALTKAMATLGATVDGKTYGPEEMIRLDVLWGRKFATNVTELDQRMDAAESAIKTLQSAPAPAGGITLPAQVTITGTISQGA